MDNLDTDQILPKQFLTTIERAGLSAGLFHDLRFDEEGALRPDFVLNGGEYADAEILITGANFGCGSSREHAVWALAEFGVRCIIAVSFGDIFRSNCLNNAVLPLTQSRAQISLLLSQCDRGAFQIDVGRKTLRAPMGEVSGFEISEAEIRKLTQGLDDITLTLRHESAIAAFERRAATGVLRQPRVDAG